MKSEKDKIRLDGPMSYDHWSPITPEQAAEARRCCQEFAKECKERIEKEFGDKSGE